MASSPLSSLARSALACLALVGVASTGCGSAGAGSTDTGTFATTAASVVTTDAGTFKMELHSAPDAMPSRGNNALRFVVTKAADGTPADGLVLAVVPWMPAMGHGSSVTPTVEAGPEPGEYTVTNVNLFMPGLWEIRTTIGGSTSDHATAQFEIE